MKFRTRERRESTVDLTSLIDVVFLLLIFFNLLLKCLKRGFLAAGI